MHKKGLLGDYSLFCFMTTVLIIDHRICINHCPCNWQTWTFFGNCKLLTLLYFFWHALLLQDFYHQINSLQPELWTQTKSKNMWIQRHHWYLECTETNYILTMLTANVLSILLSIKKEYWTHLALSAHFLKLYF